LFTLEGRRAAAGAAVEGHSLMANPGESVADDLGYLPGGDADGLTQMQAFARNARAPSMRHTFKIRLPEIRPGFVVCQAVPPLSARNSMGGVHGGYAAVLLDSACGNAVHTMLGPGQTYATVEI